MEKQSSEEFIEFQDIEDENSSEAVSRQCFRIPVSGKADFSFIIEDRTYSIVNISINGLGTLVDPDDSFFLGQTIEDCKLVLLKEKITGLTGEIVHCSQDVSGQRMCGIKWIDPDSRILKKIESILLSMQKELFKKNQSEI